MPVCKVRRGRARLALAAVTLVVALGATPAASGTRAAMRAIFDALVELMPLSLTEARFEARAERPRVEAALQRMLDNAEGLRRHGADLPASYEFLRQTLVNDLSQAEESYRLGHFEAARFLVHDVVNACFGCHTRLPETERFDMGAELLGQSEVASLPLAERALLATAARQFDTALGLYEALFLAAGESPSNIAYSGAFENYLKIAVRVRGDLERTSAAFRRFLERGDVPTYLRIHVESWLEALAELRVAELPEDGLEAGRQVFREAQLRSLFPEDPRALVHFVEASRLLHGYVQAHAADADAAAAPARDRLGEAYYLLGVAESHITSNYWYSETEFFLESAIRLSPGSSYARKAYAWLEEDVLMGYSGSAGLALPEDVAEYLGKLRRLIETRPPPLE